MRDPLPSTLGLDEQSQQRRARADFELGRLRQAAISLRDPQDVLVRPTRESEVASVASLQGMALTGRELVGGQQHSLGLPEELQRYTRTMDEAACEPAGTPVSLVLKGVARRLAGMGAETVDDENIPWRSSNWSFATLLDSAPAPNTQPHEIPARARQLFGWMDAPQMPVLDTVAAGVLELIALDPFSNTLGVLAVYGDVMLRTAERLPAQILPFSQFFVSHLERFRRAYQDVAISGDYNEWFRFIADCVIEQSGMQVTLAEQLSRLPDFLERKVGGAVRRDGYSRLLRMFSRFQFVDAPLVAKCCKLTVKRARELLHKAEENGIVIQVGGGRKNKTYEVIEVRHLIKRYAAFVRDIDIAALRDDD